MKSLRRKRFEIPDTVSGRTVTNRGVHLAPFGYHGKWLDEDREDGYWTGLLKQMSREEVEAVLAHEVSHVANGDMVTMALIQGVVNTFVVFLSRLVGFFVDRVLLKNDRGLGIGYYLSSIIAQIVFGILASAIVMWFSRRREFRADAGGASLAGREKMISALQRLQSTAGQAELPEQMAAFGISGRTTSGLKALFLSHPPLEQRIAALKSARIG